MTNPTPQDVLTALLSVEPTSQEASLAQVCRLMEIQVEMVDHLDSIKNPIIDPNHVPVYVALVTAIGEIVIKILRVIFNRRDSSPED